MSVVQEVPEVSSVRAKVEDLQRKMGAELVALRQELEGVEARAKLALALRAVGDNEAKSYEPALKRESEIRVLIAELERVIPTLSLAERLQEYREACADAEAAERERDKLPLFVGREHGFPDADRFEELLAQNRAGTRRFTPAEGMDVARYLRARDRFFGSTPFAIHVNRVSLPGNVLSAAPVLRRALEK